MHVSRAKIMVAGAQNSGILKSSFGPVDTAAARDSSADADKETCRGAEECSTVPMGLKSASISGVWIAWKMSEPSFPAYLRIASAPAGCSSRNSVKSNTCPSMATQHDFAVECWPSSPQEMERSPPAAGESGVSGGAASANGATRPVLAGAGAAAASTEAHVSAVTEVSCVHECPACSCGV